VLRSKNVSRLGLAKILIGMDDGSCANMSGVEYISCCAYRLEPKEGINDLDGEVIESGPIQAKVMPAALKVHCKKY
jgi:sphingosine kinase